MSDLKPISRLGPNLRRLVEFALRVRKKAYAPYSNYPVGCAILDDKGRIHTGCNVETASYTGLHAEVVAVGKMASSGGRRIEVVVVVASEQFPAFPCGDCLQVIAEFGLASSVLSVNGKGNLFRQVAFRDLLPFSFTQEDLKR